jgi:hypothetical protein
MKEYAFFKCTDLGHTIYDTQFSNGHPKHSTPRQPVTDLQGYINEGWVIVNTHIHCGLCDRDTATYRFILEREVSDASEKLSGGP